MTRLQTLIVQKMTVLAWRDRVSSAIPTSEGGYVMGSFPTVHAGEKMLESLIALRDINTELVGYHIEISKVDPSDFQAVDEAMYLTMQNATLDSKIADIESLLDAMRVL